MRKSKNFENGFVELSTGDIVNIYPESLNDAIEKFDNLISAAVMVHFDEILKSKKQNGDTNTMPILIKEVHHLVSTQFVNHGMCLRWILMTLLKQRFDLLLNESKRKSSKNSIVNVIKHTKLTH